MIIAGVTGAIGKGRQRSRIFNFAGDTITCMSHPHSNGNAD